jgi:outer membrane biosynthesis protein TonB
MRTALVISASAHAAVLLWGLVSFGVKPLEAGAVESLPVDIISDSDFSQLTAGVRNAAKVEKPSRLVEKIDTPTPVDESTPKVAPKPEIRTASAEPMPVPEVKPPEPKPEKAKAEPAPDPVAEALKKEEAKRKEEAKKREEQKRREEAKKREEQKKKEQAFDPNQVAALLDKRHPQRQAAAGDTLNTTPSLGLPSGTAATLSQNEIDALRAQIQACWNPPAGALEAKELVVRVRLQLKQDGALSAEPALLNRGNHPVFQIAAESAIRAIKRCQPYKLPIAKYQIWRDVEVTFDPREMFRG